VKQVCTGIFPACPERKEAVTRCAARFRQVNRPVAERPGQGTDNCCNREKQYLKYFCHIAPENCDKDTYCFHYNQILNGKNRDYDDIFERPLKLDR
jgi:hypothetical protein